MGFLNGYLKLSAGMLQKLFSANGSFCTAYRVRGGGQGVMGGLLRVVGIIAQAAEVKWEKGENFKSGI